MSGHFKNYWLPVVLWAILIFVLSSISRFPEAVEPLFSLDKLIHAGEYAVLAFLLARAFKHSSKEQIVNNFRLLALVAAVIYAVSDEFHQSFIPYRTADIKDFFSDAIGAFIGQMFFK